MYFHKIVRGFFKYWIQEYCPCCFQAISMSEYILCEHCFKILQSMICLTPIDRIDIKSFPLSYSLIDYHQMKNYWDVLNQIKFYNQKYYLYLLLNYLPDLSFLNCDCIVYVPISFKRYIERGFNLSYIIAKAFSKKLNLPCIDLLNKKDTVKQSDRNRKSRLDIINNNPFSIKKKYLKSNLGFKKLLLIDDIITTGATVSTIHQAIKKTHQVQVVTFSLFHSEKTN